MKELKEWQVCLIVLCIICFSGVMFIGATAVRKSEEIFTRIAALEAEKYIGELYFKDEHCWVSDKTEFCVHKNEWLKFTQSSIEDKVEGFVKIADEWHSDFFYYKDVDPALNAREAKRKEIENLKSE